MLPSDLHEAMARNLDVSATLVSTYARRLREAGLISRGGRGTSAARMSVGDASVLLLAVAGSPGPSEAVSQIAAFGETRYAGGPGKGVLGGLGLQERGMSGSAAVLALMTAASTGVMDDVLRDAGVMPDYAAQAFEVSFVVTAPVGVQIRFSGYSGQSAKESAAYTCEEVTARRMWSVCTVSGRSLISLGRALRP